MGFINFDANYNIDNPLPTGNTPQLIRDDTECVKYIADMDIKNKDVCTYI